MWFFYLRRIPTIHTQIDRTISIATRLEKDIVYLLDFGIFLIYLKVAVQALDNFFC